MKAACILVIRCGAGSMAATTLKDTLQPVVEGRYEVSELILPGSIGEEKGDQVTLAIRRENPSILIFCPSSNRVIGEASALCELGRQKNWDVPIMAAIETEQPDEL